MLHDLKRPLPIRARPLHRETAASHLARLVESNFLTEDKAALLVSAVAHNNPGLSSCEAVERTAEWKGGLDEGFFERHRTAVPLHSDGATCERCFTGISDQYMCRLCAVGASVQLHPHLDGNVCLRHHLWVGPGTAPDAQYQVGSDAVEADVLFRKLVRKGRIDAPLLAAVTEAFVLRRVREGSALELDGAEYRLLVHVAREVTSRTFIERFFAPDQASAQARATLNAVVSSIVHEGAGWVVDYLWSYLRPMMLRARGRAETASGNSASAIQHDIRTKHPVGASATASRTSAEPVGYYAALFEHTERTDHTGRTATSGSDIPGFTCDRGHLHPAGTASASSGVTSCPYRHEGVQLRTVLAELGWDMAGNRRVDMSKLTLGSPLKATWRCAFGHRFGQSVNNRVKGRGCQVCAGHVVEWGKTGLLLTDTALSFEWHHERNGTLTPGRVLAGSGTSIWWLCVNEHAYPATLDNRASGKACPVCANLKIEVGTNDLETTHPRVAATWHPTMNGDKTPQHVVAGNGRTKFWWLCDEGHPYDALITNRVAGKGCRYCANLEPLLGFNTLADIDPGLSEEWHPTKNGTRTPSTELAGSGKKAWWLCNNKHDFEQVIVKRRAGQSCPYCANRKVWPGFNDVAIRYPLLMLDWDWATNDVEPSEVLPGNTKRHWQCRHGHKQHQPVPNRVKTGGCTKCPLAERAAAVDGNA
ncbi:zinc-ribbon domain-containing protein [Cryobacterium tagatosivorans]|uniref:zinc-ribbon domain-containing protein n=1 Tax=Cryobacterium tagatosivorans TaxID=1259199 RepID=UPI00141AC22E|nr:zinc-ribbon domain-containing protein [Cryobacterium tagatosivorans]